MILTENEIISALERMSEEDPNGFSSDILGVINRQKAEIEKLKETPKCIYAYDGETMEYCVEGPCSVEKNIEEIKSEARKEFAERVWVESAKILGIDTLYWIKEIKNKLLAAMEGGKEE